VRRLFAVVATVAALSSAIVVSSLLGAGSAGATQSGAPGISADTSYAIPSEVSASVDGIVNGPWNSSQGDPTLGTPYYEQSPSLLFPTYTPSQLLSSNPFDTTTEDPTSHAEVTEPNLAVYPTGSGTQQTPYPSGVAGTPGPDDDYCSSGGKNPETGTVNSEPEGVDLPFAPYYFPDIVRNADGSLTGYFDYRPKDTDEAITVARSTNDGVTWTTEGTALDQNQGYCPTADANDDGQGHPFVMSTGSKTELYTLQRAAGDNPASACSFTGSAPPRLTRSAACPRASRSGSTPIPSPRPQRRFRPWGASRSRSRPWEPPAPRSRSSTAAMRTCRPGAARHPRARSSTAPGRRRHRKRKKLDR